MKLNIAYPTNGTQKSIQIDKNVEMKLYDKKVGSVIPGELISEDFQGYLLKITGGDDLQGFPMKSGVLTTKRVRLLLKKGDKGYRCIRDGVRKRKSVRGCIISNEIAVVSLIITKAGEKPIEGLTDKVEQCSHLPKRATKLRRTFNIPKGEDLKASIKKIILAANEGEKKKMPRLRITRLTTPRRIERKARRKEALLARKAKAVEEKRAYVEKYLKV